MAMKGSTIIELTNVKTGEKEVLEHENMMTNAVRDLFAKNIEGALYNIGTYAKDLKNELFPLCPNAIGGILLFSDTLEEDADKYYAPSDNPCVGYASNDVNSTANELRGSLNLNESKKTENGYKFVWDFSTSQGNGTISAVALTHKYGGAGYFGDIYDNQKKAWTIRSTPSEYNPSAEVRAIYTNTVEIDFENNLMYTIGLERGTGGIVIRKWRKDLTKIGVNAPLFAGALNDVELIEETTINPEIFKIVTSVYSGNAYALFYDGKDGFWYGMWGGGNSSGNATIKWIKIDKKDCSFTEGTWTFENVQLYYVGCTYDMEGQYSNSRYSVMHKGYLYVMGYDRLGVYKINVNNAADITFIEFGFKSGFSSTHAGSAYMWVLNDWICGYDFRINTLDEVIRTKGESQLSYSTDIYGYGPYVYALGFYSNYIYKNIFLLSPYLATINNLSTSVIKTADKTMKITYTITETE